MNRRLVFLVLATALTGVGCDDEGSGPRDGGLDGGAEVTSDVGGDVGSQGGKDAGADVLASDAISGDGSAALPPGVQGTRWNALGETERKQVCDWAAAQFGGYGQARTCPDGTMVSSLYLSQGECLVTLQACDATVGALESCFLAMAREICSEDLPAECQSLAETCI